MDKDTICFHNFNSIKVRLKQFNIPNVFTLRQFQFHKGTIKTNEKFQ